MLTMTQSINELLISNLNASNHRMKFSIKIMSSLGHTVNDAESVDDAIAQIRELYDQGKWISINGVAFFSQASDEELRAALLATGEDSVILATGTLAGGCRR